MAVRAIYFIKDNTLYEKRIEVPWEKECSKVNRIVSKIILDNSKDIPHPCLDLSSSSGYTKELSLYNIKSNKGQSVKELWDTLDNSKDIELMPPGFHELIYIASLNERQLNLILCGGSFYDIYFNPTNKHRGSIARACACLKLLYKQNKLDYVLDYNMFLWWYYANCSCPTLWDKSK